MMDQTSEDSTVVQLDHINKSFDIVIKNRHNNNFKDNSHIQRFFMLALTMQLLVD